MGDKVIGDGKILSITHNPSSIVLIKILKPSQLFIINCSLLIIHCSLLIVSVFFSLTAVEEEHAIRYVYINFYVPLRSL
jgi:hypothetical protein